MSNVTVRGGSNAGEVERIGDLAQRAARVQDLFGDLELALLRRADPLGTLASLKAAWREFRDAVLAQPAAPVSAPTDAGKPKAD